MVLVLASWALINSTTIVSADLTPWHKDIQLLSSKLAQLRSQLQQTEENIRNLSKAESAVGRLKELANQMAELQTDIDAAESRLHYLKEMEVDPKSREVDRLNKYYEQAGNGVIQDLRSVQGLIDRHNARRPTCPENASGPCDAYDGEASELNGRQERLKASLERLEAERQEAVERAIQAYANAQKEFAEAEAKSGKLAEKMTGLKQQYIGVREPLVKDMVDMEVSVPLTPYPNGVPPSEAGWTPVFRPPIGPGSNTRAIDQLRIVTSSSRSAAGRDNHDEGVNSRKDEVQNRVASIQSGYTFDTGGGLDPAELPKVPTPEGRLMEPEPLILPTATAERNDAPPALKNSPVLVELKRQRSEALKNLDRLYRERREIVTKGPGATAKELTTNNNDINATQSRLLWNVYLEGASGGSKVTKTPPPLEPSQAEIDTTITPKRRRTSSDIVVPPPAESAPSKQPESPQ